MFNACSIVQTFSTPDGLHTLKVARVEEFLAVLKKRGVKQEKIHSLIAMLEPYPKSDVVLIERLERALQIMKSN
jgi:hypothetical protein